MEPDRRQTLTLLSAWAVAFIAILTAVWFLHEVAHGFGYRLEGTRVSTGFNVVGASGKKPSDPDFRIDLPVEGMSTGLLLGPFVSWLMAILFTGILLHRSIPNPTTLLIGATAVASALMRLMPLAIFFLAALSGSISGVLQDEQEMSIGAIEGLDLPISRSELAELLESEPATFLENPGFYFWAAVSAGISLICMMLAYRHLFQIYEARMQSRMVKFAFGLAPFVLFFIVFGLVSFLDNVVRINW